MASIKLQKTQIEELAQRQAQDGLTIDKKSVEGDKTDSEKDQKKIS